MTAVRRRVGDRKVLALVKAFLGAQILRETGRLEAPIAYFAHRERQFRGIVSARSGAS
jgi:hypothetical protein